MLFEDVTEVIEWEVSACDAKLAYVLGNHWLLPLDLEVELNFLLNVAFNLL